MTRLIQSPDGTSIGRFAFGTMQFGGNADENASAGMFEASLAAGITHFDTAYNYTDGRSEQILGRLAAPHRDRLVIATKVGYDNTRATTLRSHFDICRQRLDMDSVDILYLHRFDAQTDLGETFDTLADFKAEGLIRHIGVSNFAAWQVMKAVAVAAARDLTIDIIQPMYNLVKRQAEVEIFPMARDQGIVIAPYSPLGGGLLSGKYSNAEATGRIVNDSHYATRYGVDWMHRAAADLSDIAREIGIHPATLAVAWAARHPAGPFPILSARNADQLAPSLAAIDFDMDDALYARLSALSPTPPPATDRLEEA
ncbi:aldo/keto reductase [Pelagimonas sp. KU-00592-HH]|uniref:aldo/keto reductase n=1 Tax=Pelagimonas sp. KU-00592-HH TaxID=3127651 RepID=UPI003102F330